MLRKAIYLCILSAALVLCPAAQDKKSPSTNAPSADAYVAPISWERYAVSSEKISFVLPKLPAVAAVGDSCQGQRGAVHYAYADNAVYEVRYYAKTKDRAPVYCFKTKRFGPESLENRLAELRASDPGPNSETSVELQTRKASVFTWETPASIQKRWVISDMDNNRWVELAIYRRIDSAVNETRFLEGLQFSDASGIDVRGGSIAALGDTGSISPAPADGQDGKAEEPVIVISKPRAQYTEEARRANTQGKVRLKITFLANGAIGAMTVVNGLSNGLTEQSLFAARRIVFLPKRINGVPASAVKQVEYSFSIY